MNSYLCYNCFDIHSFPLFVVPFYNIRPIYISLDFFHPYQYIFFTYCIKYNFELTLITTYYVPANYLLNVVITCIVSTNSYKTNDTTTTIYGKQLNHFGSKLIIIIMILITDHNKDVKFRNIVWSYSSSYISSTRNIIVYKFIQYSFPAPHV